MRRGTEAVGKRHARGQVMARTTNKKPGDSAGSANVGDEVQLWQRPTRCAAAWTRPRRATPISRGN